MSEIFDSLHAKLMKPYTTEANTKAYYNFENKSIRIALYGHDIIELFNNDSGKIIVNDYYANTQLTSKRIQTTLKCTSLVCIQDRQLHLLASGNEYKYENGYVQYNDRTSIWVPYRQNLIHIIYFNSIGSNKPKILLGEPKTIGDEKKICQEFTEKIVDYCKEGKVINLEVQIVVNKEKAGYKLLSWTAGFNIRKFTKHYTDLIIEKSELKGYKDSIFKVQVQLETNSLKKAKIDLERRKENGIRLNSSI